MPPPERPTLPTSPTGLTRRESLGALAALAANLAAVPGAAQAQAAPNAAAWERTLQASRGQTVYFNAWAGSEQINAYLQWAGQQLQADFGITFEHVKISDTAEVVKRVRGEKVAGRGPGQGSVDLVWINGENFAAMKREGLLFGPFATALPNFKWVDTRGKPTTLTDFSVPSDGMEAPWGMAQLTFFADSQRLPLAQTPQDMAGLLTLAKRQPGRITYPRLPDFHGSTFVKQALTELAPDRSALARPVTPEAFARQAAPLWAFLDALHPHLWRRGKQFAQSAAAIRQMMADGELLLGLTFNPNEAANEIAAGRLSPTVRSWQFDKGSLGNTHFVAIPFNARSPAAAQVAANFLLSPLAQARKADITVWGDPTVLDLPRLPPAERSLFRSAKVPGLVSRSAPAWPEPHASWTDAIDREWVKRYGA